MKATDYFIGLDMGTDSLGWAVTDTAYNMCKCKGNAMWGTMLFDESQTAQERRLLRAQRRRGQRRRERLALLETLFDAEIAKKDIAFFQKLKESNLYLEDRTTDCPYTLFNDTAYTDAEYHTDYPTVYHLRKALLESRAPHDVRLVFLALHHILKGRGHFLFDGLSAAQMQDFGSIFREFCILLQDEYDLTLYCPDTEALAALLKDRTRGKLQKKKAVFDCCGISKKENEQLCAILSALVGSKTKLKDIFADEALEEAEVKAVDFSGKFEEDIPALQSALGDRFELIERAKAIYDWAVLADILDGETYISVAKVKQYKKHQSDLALLKQYVKAHCPEKYKEIFKYSREKLDNYTAYSGHYKANGKTGVLQAKCTQEAFCAYLRKVLPKSEDGAYAPMFSEIENATFMPKQISTANSVIPMQLNRMELVKILENAEGYLPFLTARDESGLTVSEKIIKLFDYRIPYYVGPLNPHSDKAWLVRGSEKITPWNFEQVVDLDASAEAFIQHLTSKCTYLPSQDVIPKNSLLYSAFTVLNELNNLRLNGEKISVELKQKIYTELFMQRKKVTGKALKTYLKTLGYDDVEITGIDGDFKSTLKTFIELRDYPLSDAEKESVVHAITIFGEDKRLLRKRLKLQLGEKLNEQQIVKLSHLTYTGWSALSKAFLTEIYSADPRTGEAWNIIRALWETNDNLMVLLGSAYHFGEALTEAQSGSADKTVQAYIDELYVSPKNKRAIHQAVNVVKEIVKLQGGAPKKIFIEMARGEEAKRRTKSRKTQLLELYKTCKQEADELYAKLETTPESDLRQDKLYLYYTQLGRDMYTGKPIPLEALSDKNLYDIDHIYPRSKVKDDSLQNRVLVYKVDNINKSNDYPLQEDIRRRMYPHWKFLLEHGLIEKEKFNRLTGSAPLTDAQLHDFIARQLVETRQSTKAVATLFSRLYGAQTEIVYVKARNVSDFRQQYEMLKCREVNDLHHAKDAYLNIVVGNVYNEKYTHNKANFIRGLQTSAFSLNRMFDYDVENAWVATEDASLKTVIKWMSKNNIRYTRYAFIQSGGLFDQQPLKKGKGQVPLKCNSPRADIAKYGGYNGPTAAYFALVEYDGKKDKKIRALIAVDLYRVDKYEENPDLYMQTYMELKNAHVLIRRIKYNACLSFNGCRMHISSKSSGGARIVYKPGMQLVLSQALEQYCKKISNFVQKGWDRPYTQYDHLSAERNMELFDELCRKMTETTLSVCFGSFGAKIQKKRDVFCALSVQEQCYTLLEMLKILHANVMAGDLTMIGEAKNAGKILTNSKLSEIKNVTSIQLIHQSATGLFEQAVDLI